MGKKNKVNILIVDDKPANIFALEQMLAKTDRNFMSATTGNEALKTVLNNDICLIILDVQMPEMDGFEVAQILKSNKRTKDIPIIFASAEKKEHQFMMKGFEEGAIDYLYKPLDKEITEAKVAVLLKLHLQKKELIEKNAELEKYALLINNSADIICIINPDTLKFEEVNQAALPLLGYAPAELKDTALDFYLTQEYRFKLRELRRETREKFAFETQLLDKERRLKWFHWNIVNKNNLWFANARDITEAKEVEEIKNYLAIVVKQSNDAIYLLDPEGRIISWNQGAVNIYGFSETEALKMSIWNIVPEFLRKEAHALVESVLKSEKIQALETKRITKYGKIIDVVFSASAITGSDNSLKSIAITERDITQQKIADREIKQLNSNLKNNVAQLENTNKELESFSYSVSHDLRAPLRAINGYSGIIQEEFKDQLDDELKRLFGIIQNNARKMGLLIDDLLAFSKLGRKEVIKKPVNITELAHQALHELQNAMPPGLKTTVPELPPAEADPALLYQVLLNLLGNAIKYSAKTKNPEISLNSFETEDENVYLVKDNGAGFPMEYNHKLFGVFQRLHPDHEFEGTGVGLAIVQRIVVKHGGRVWAEGEPGKGATFYFSLPKPASA